VEITLEKVFEEINGVRVVDLQIHAVILLCKEAHLTVVTALHNMLRNIGKIQPR
jgi:hypothetical protein